jgi:hypothetical protein
MATTLAFACTACTLITSLTDLDSKTEQTPAGSDASTSEASSAPDAPTKSNEDAGTDSSSPPPPIVCDDTNPLVFCDAFDVGTLGAKWDSQRFTNGAQLTTTPTAVSPPYGFLSATPVTADGDHGAVFEKRFVGNVSKIDCGFWMRIEEGPNDNRFGPFIIQMTGAPGSGFNAADVNLAIAKDGVTVRMPAFQTDGGQTYSDGPIGAPAINTWFHLRVVITMKPSPRVSLTYSLDGDAQAPTQFSGAVQFPTETTEQKLTFGTTHYGGNGPWKVLYDNLVCIRTP